MYFAQPHRAMHPIALGHQRDLVCIAQAKVSLGCALKGIVPIEGANDSSHYGKDQLL